MEIRDDTTIKLGDEILNIPDIISNASKGQLDFICSFIYYLTVFEWAQSKELIDGVNTLYRRIHRDGVEAIHQKGLYGSSQIEYVRKHDIISILYRLKNIFFENG